MNHVNDREIEPRLVALVESAIPFEGARLTHWFELKGERTTRDDGADGYDERKFNIAWVADKQSGTHRACLDNNDRSMLVWGHMFIGDQGDNSLIDLINRTTELADISLDRVHRLLTKV